MIKKIIWIILFVAFLIFIFKNSATSGVDSALQSGRVLEILQNLLGDRSWLTDHLVRKLAHFTEYFILGIFGANIFCTGYKGMSLALLVGMSAALSDETIQVFSNGRSSQLTDVWIDVSGYALGMLIALAVNWLFGLYK